MLVVFKSAPILKRTLKVWKMGLTINLKGKLIPDVVRIRIRIRMRGFMCFGPPGSASRSVIFCKDPDPSINKQKTLISTMVCDFFMTFFIFDVNVHSKTNNQKSLEKRNHFWLASWWSLPKRAGSGAGSVPKNVTDPEHRLIEWLTASISTEKRKESTILGWAWSSFGDWENRSENPRSQSSHSSVLYFPRWRVWIYVRGDILQSFKSSCTEVRIHLGLLI